MTTQRLDDLLTCLARVAQREERRAHEEFTAKYGRRYEGENDDDWDELDKDFAGVEEAMNVVRAMHGVRAAVAHLAL